MRKKDILTIIPNPDIARMNKDGIYEKCEGFLVQIAIQPYWAKRVICFNLAYGYEIHKGVDIGQAIMDYLDEHENDLTALPSVQIE